MLRHKLYNVGILVAIIMLFLLNSRLADSGGISLGLSCHDAEGNDCFNPKVDNWYAVEDWEIDVCRMWGGPTDVVEELTTFDEPLSMFTLTLQAERILYPDNSKLYTVSYFLDMQYDEALSFQVFLMNDTTNLSVGLGQVTQGSSAGDYLTLTSNAVYDIAMITLSDGRTLAVPVIDKNSLGVPECEECGYTG